MGEVRSPVALLRSVSPWERVGGEVVEKRRRPAGEFQGVETPPDVGKGFSGDGGQVMKPTMRIRTGLRGGGSPASLVQEVAPRIVVSVPRVLRGR